MYSSSKRRQMSINAPGTDVGTGRRGMLSGGRRGVVSGCGAAGGSGIGTLGVRRGGGDLRVGLLGRDRRPRRRRGAGRGALLGSAPPKTRGKSAGLRTRWGAVGRLGSLSGALDPPVSERRPSSVTNDGRFETVGSGGRLRRREPRSRTRPVARSINRSDSLFGVAGSELPRGRRNLGRIAISLPHLPNLCHVSLGSGAAFHELRGLPFRGTLHPSLTASSDSRTCFFCPGLPAPTTTTAFAAIQSLHRWSLLHEASETVRRNE